MPYFEGNADIDPKRLRASIEETRKNIRGAQRRIDAGTIEYRGEVRGLVPKQIARRKEAIERQEAALAEKLATLSLLP